MWAGRGNVYLAETCRGGWVECGNHHWSVEKVWVIVVYKSVCGSSSSCQMNPHSTSSTTHLEQNRRLKLTVRNFLGLRKTSLGMSDRVVVVVARIRHRCPAATESYTEEIGEWVCMSRCFPHHRTPGWAERWADRRLPATNISAFAYLLTRGLFQRSGQSDVLNGGPSHRIYIVWRIFGCVLVKRSWVVPTGWNYRHLSMDNWRYLSIRNEWSSSSKVSWWNKCYRISVNSAKISW